MCTTVSNVFQFQPAIYAAFIKGTLKAYIKSALIVEITVQKPLSVIFVPRKGLF